jgi:hypothetical protein
MKNFRLTKGVTLTGVLGAALLASTGAMAADSAIIQWNNAMLQGIRTNHPGPPMVARMLAVAHTCMYDAWAAYDKKAIGTQFGGSLRQPKALRTLSNKSIAISYAGYRAAVDLMPASKPYFTAQMIAMGLDPNYTAQETSTAAGIGNTACAAVLAFRHADGSNQLGDVNGGAPYSDYSGYVPVNSPTVINDPARWQPLTVSDGHGGTVTQKFIAPFWGQVKPFALKSVSQYAVKPPAVPGTAAFKTQVDQVLAYSANLTDKQKVIAEYWADGPSSELPPGHWNLFAQFVSHRDGYDVDTDAKMFFAVNNALLDASVWTWGVKRIYDYVRPVTAVHWQYAGQTVHAWGGAYQGTLDIPAANWRPYQAVTVVTPPFAEYVSGHSTFSSAAAEVLKLFTHSDAFGGSYTQPAGVSNVEPSTVPTVAVKLTWATFKDAADEAGISRRYGGIHFIDGDLEGRRVGPKIGKAAYKLSKQLFNGGEDEGEGGDD